MDRAGWIGAAFIVHNLALDVYLKEQSKAAGVKLDVRAYTGESFGILTSLVATGALSVTDGVRLAQYFTPCVLRVAREVIKEDYFVIGISGRDIEDVMQILSQTFDDAFEIHKFFAQGPRQQYNVYVGRSIINDFRELMKTNFADVEYKELKAPTQFIAHSKKLAKARQMFEEFIVENNIQFNTPNTSIISNNRSGVIISAAQAKAALLATIDEPMYSSDTVADADLMDADLIMEIGLGGKARELLQTNLASSSIIEFTGEDQEVWRGQFQATQMVAQLRGMFDELAQASADYELGALEYDQLRSMFKFTRNNELGQTLLLNFIADAVNRELLVPTRNKPAAYYKLLEICQNTYLVNHVMKSSVLAEDALVLSTVFKKRILSATSQDSDKIDVEVMMLDRHNARTVATLMQYKYPETVMFNFNRVDHPFSTIVHEAAYLIGNMPIAKTIYDQLTRDFNLPSDYFTKSMQAPEIKRYHTAIMAYQFALFEILQTYRPSLLGQNSYAVTGSDDLGVLVALAASGALSITDAIKLLFFSREDPGLFARTLETVEIKHAKIKVSDLREGGFMKTRQQILTYLQGLPSRFTKEKAPVRPLDSWIVSFEAKGKSPVSLGEINPEHYVNVSSLTDIWKRNVNVPLDMLEDLSILRLTDRNGKVYQFAENRGTTTSNVYPYINADEEIVGFGTGGSESLTIFLRQQPGGPIIVRKVLSEKLVTARWDRDGKGVMLPPFAKAKNQAEYLRGLPNLSRLLFPEVLNVVERNIPAPPKPGSLESDDTFHELFYDMTYIPGLEASEFVRQYQPSPEVVAKLYTEIFRMLRERVHSQRLVPSPGGTLEESYFSKIEKRLALSQQTAPKIFTDEMLNAEHITINGQRYLNIGPLLRAFRNHPEYLSLLEPKNHSLVMGDTNTENVKITNLDPILRAMERGDTNFTGLEIGIKFLDPRSIGFHSVGAETRDDFMYDNKPWHNSTGRYDAMHGEHFDLEVERSPDGPVLSIDFHKDSPYVKPYEGIGQLFKKTMEDAWDIDKPDSEIAREDPYWLIRFVFMMGTHFAAMPPFHFKREMDDSMVQDYTHQKRPVAIYAEGIRWLNAALEMLEGQRTEFLGVAVPVLPYTPKDGVTEKVPTSPAQDFAMLSEATVLKNMADSGPAVRFPHLTNETRAFPSPWVRVMRGAAAGQYPVAFDPTVAGYIRKAFKETTEKAGPSNQYNNFSNALSEFILDMNDPQKTVTAQEAQQKAQGLLDALYKIDNAHKFVSAGALMIDSFAKLGVDLSVLNAQGRDVVRDLLEKVRESNQGERGAYEMITAYASLFMALGQAGLQSRIVGGERNYAQMALDSLALIPDGYGRGRGAGSLLSALAILGFKDMVIGGKIDYVKQTLDHLDETLDHPPSIEAMKKRNSYTVYPIDTMLNAIALLGEPSYVTYKRDWIKDLMFYLDKLDPPQEVSHRGMYFLVALYNLRVLDQYVPDLKGYLTDMANRWDKWADATDGKVDVVTMMMHDGYLLEIANFFNMRDIIPAGTWRRLERGFKDYPTKDPVDVWNLGNAISYPILTLFEMGRSDLMFEPSAYYDGEAPFSWAVRNFSDGAKDEAPLTLSYVNNSLVNMALSMRGTKRVQTDIFNATLFAADREDEQSERDRIKALESAIGQNFSKLGTLQGSLEPLAGGFQWWNRPYKFTTDQGEFVIKREGFSVSEKAGVVSEAVRRSSESGLKYVVNLVPNDQGEAITVINVDQYIIYPFVKGDKEVSPKQASAEHWRQTIKAKVELDAALKGLKMTLKRPVRPPNSPMIQRDNFVEQYADLSGRPVESLGPAERMYLQMYPSILRNLDLRDRGLPQELYERLPTQIIHGDLRLKNMMFNNRDELQYLYDFGHAGYAPRIQDFAGIMIYNTGIPFSYDRLVQMVALYNRLSKDPLSDEEIKAVPEMLRGTWLSLIDTFFRGPNFGFERMNADPQLFESLRIKLDNMSGIGDAFSDASANEKFLSDVKDAAMLAAEDLLTDISEPLPGFVRLNQELKPVTRAALFDMDGTLTEDAGLLDVTVDFYHMVTTASADKPDGSALAAAQRDFRNASSTFTTQYVQKALDIAAANGHDRNALQANMQTLAEQLGITEQVAGVTDLQAGYSLIYEHMLVEEAKANPPQLRAGVREFLDQLDKAGLPLYVGTGNFKRVAETMLELTGIRGRFKEVYAADPLNASMYPNGKVDMMRQVQASENIADHSGLMIVGDGINDMRGSVDGQNKFVAVGITDGSMGDAQILAGGGADFLVSGLNNWRLYWSEFGLPRTADMAMLSPGDMTNEGRAFFSPWVRIVRGMALGGDPVDFDPQLARNIKDTTKLLASKIPSDNKYNQFGNELTELILDINDPANPLSAEQVKPRVDAILTTIRSIKEPYLFVTASSVLMDSFVKLNLPVDLIVNDRADILKDALDMAWRVPDDKHGSYERVTALANIFLAAGQLGLKSRVTADNQVSRTLDLLSGIPSVYYRGRGASILFSVLASMGMKDSFINGQRDYLKETLDVFDANFVSAQEFENRLLNVPNPYSNVRESVENAVMDQTYPLYAILNVISMVRDPQYLTYKRDWIKEAGDLLPWLAPDDRINQGQYYLMALYNLGVLDRYVPDVRKTFTDWVNNYEAYLTNGKYIWERLFITMNDVYIIETARYFGMMDAVPQTVMNRVVENLKNYKVDDPYFNSAYGLSYTFTALAEIGQTGLLFDGHPAFDGEAPLKWTIGQFPGDGVAEKITLPYLNNALVNQALRMRGSQKTGDTSLFKDVGFLKAGADAAMLTESGETAFLIPGQTLEEQETKFKNLFTNTPLANFITGVRIDPAESDSHTLVAQLDTASGHKMYLKFSTRNTKTDFLRLQEFKIGFGDNNLETDEMQAAYSQTRSLTEDMLLALLMLAKQNNVKLITAGLGILGSDEFFDDELGNRFAQFQNVKQGRAYVIFRTGVSYVTSAEEKVEVKQLNIYLDNWDFPQDALTQLKDISLPVFLMPGGTVEQQEQGLRDFFAKTPLGGFLTDVRIDQTQSDPKQLVIVANTPIGEELGIKLKTKTTAASLDDFKVIFGKDNTKSKAMQEAYSSTRSFVDDLLLALLMLAKQNNVKVISTKLGYAGSDKFFEDVLGNRFAAFQNVVEGQAFEMVSTGFTSYEPDGGTVDVKQLTIPLDNWTFPETAFEDIGGPVTARVQSSLDLQDVPSQEPEVSSLLAPVNEMLNAVPALLAQDNAMMAEVVVKEAMAQYRKITEMFPVDSPYGQAARQNMEVASGLLDEAIKREPSIKREDAAMLSDQAVRAMPQNNAVLSSLDRARLVATVTSMLAGTFANPDQSDVSDVQSLLDLATVAYASSSDYSTRAWDSVDSAIFEKVKVSGQIAGRMSLRPQPVTYPKTTEMGWNNDVIALVSSTAFLDMARQGGLKSDFWDIVADIGVGAMPLTTGEMIDTLRTKNPNVKFVGTELNAGLAAAHIKITDGPVLEDFKTIASIHMNERFRKMSVATGLKSIPWVDPSKIFEVRLVVSNIGSDKNAGVSEIIVGVKDKGKTWYMTLSVAPDVRYVMKGEVVDASWKNPGIFRDFVQRYMGTDFIKAIVGKAQETPGEEAAFEFAGHSTLRGKSMISVETKPVESQLKQAGADFVATEDIGQHSSEYSLITANYVVGHMDAATQERFFATMENALQPGGVLVLKDGIPVEVENQDLNMDGIDVYQRQQTGMKFLGRVLTNAEGRLVMNSGTHRFFMENAKSESRSAPSAEFLFKDKVWSKQLRADSAMLANNAIMESEVGGIDFTTGGLPLDIQNSGEEIKFNLTPETIQKLENLHGFEPVILNIQPDASIRLFLGGQDDRKPVDQLVSAL